MDTESLKGLTNSKEIVVRHEDTAAVYGSGTLEVFATPAMVGLMEQTCLESVNDQVGEGNTTVGIKVNISHLKASPIGSHIRCESKVTETDGRRIVFEVHCYEGETLIGEGFHERVIVDSQRFMNKFK